MNQNSQVSSYSNKNINNNNESAGSNTIQTRNLSNLLRNNSNYVTLIKKYYYL